MTGTLDNIEDAIDCLIREDCVYLLVIGRPGENFTRAFSDLKGNHERAAIDTILETGRTCMEIEVKNDASGS
jgi:hypothetical protein